MHNHMKIVNRNATIEHNVRENAARFVHFWANFHALKHYHKKKQIKITARRLIAIHIHAYMFILQIWSTSKRLWILFMDMYGKMVWLAYS